MVLPKSIAQLGPLLQTAFVARDLDPLVEHWTKRMGAGPFFKIANLSFNYTIFRGVRQQITIDAILGNWGDMQMEFIRPHDDSPSVYSEWLNAGRSGVHHFAITVPDLKVARETVERASMTIAQESAAYNGEPFYYVDMGFAYLEIICPDAGMTGMFDMIRQAHRAWDGSDPLRAAPAEEIGRGAAKL